MLCLRVNASWLLMNQNASKIVSKSMKRSLVDCRLSRAQTCGTVMVEPRSFGGAPVDSSDFPKALPYQTRAFARHHDEIDRLRFALFGRGYGVCPPDDGM
jgi:hypothetical protein